jgi:putative ABC transport system ATP-binding protein
MNEMIVLQKISKVYGMDGSKVQALKDVDLEVREGEFMAVMGPSGSGKSTLMNIVGCLDRPTSGSYILFGKEIAGLDDNELAFLRNRKIGIVFQTFNLLKRTTALENVELPLIYASAPDRRNLAIKALDKVGLGDRIRHKSNELSGGEQQRVAIARAIVHSPSLLLADEPTGNLDTKAGFEIMRIFKDLNEEGQTVIIVTHDDEIGRMTNRIIRFRDGELIKDERNPNPFDPWKVGK